MLLLVLFSLHVKHWAKKRMHCSSLLGPFCSRISSPFVRTCDPRHILIDVHGFVFLFLLAASLPTNNPKRVLEERKKKRT